MKAKLERTAALPSKRGVNPERLLAVVRAVHCKPAPSMVPDLSLLGDDVIVSS